MNRNCGDVFEHSCDIYMRNMFYRLIMYEICTYSKFTQPIIQPVVIQCETGIFIDDTMYYYSRSGLETCSSIFSRCIFTWSWVSHQPWRLRNASKVRISKTDFIGVYESTGCHTVDVSVRSLASLPGSMSSLRPLRAL